MRLDVSTRTVRAGIIVRNKSDGRYLVLSICLQCSVDVALVVHLHVAQSLVLQLLLQVLCKHQLFRRTRHCLAILARLCVELCIV